MEMRDDKNPTMPPPEVLAGVREEFGITLAPDGGWQRIIHRYSSAARDETARRIARRKRAGSRFDPDTGTP